MPATTEERLLKLVQTVQTGEEAERSAAFEALQKSFRPLLYKTVARYRERLPSHEQADLLQEASITLYRAAMGFRTEQTGVTFGYYARVCLHNRFVSLLKAESARPRVVGRDVEQMADRRPAPEKAPYRPRTKEERSFVRTAKLLGLPPEPELAASFRRRLMRRLSPLEKIVFRRFFAGDSYEKIAEELQKSEKSVDNALTRIRRKAKALRASLPAEK